MTTLIQIGDVVALRGGGPRMTVTWRGPVACATGEWATCPWLDEQGELRQDMFSTDTVRTGPRPIPAGSVRWGALAHGTAR